MYNSRYAKTQLDQCTTPLHKQINVGSSLTYPVFLCYQLVGATERLRPSHINTTSLGWSQYIYIAHGCNEMGMI